MTTKNMDLWNRVCAPDPQYLKKVSFGQRSFTAIDPQYQIMQATEQFGPVGDKWGWDATTEFVHIANGDVMVISNVSIWRLFDSTGSGNWTKRSFGSFPGCRKFVYTNKNGMTVHAEDAPKMAVTDALTKCLSHLGFDADVFLGKMDGNKYADPNATKNEGTW